MAFLLGICVKNRSQPQVTIELPISDNSERGECSNTLTIAAHVLYIALTYAKGGGYLLMY